MDEIRNMRIPPRIAKLPLADKEPHGEPPKGWRFSIDGQQFDFVKGKIQYNGQDLAKHLSENLTHLGANYWTNLSRRLALYRDYATLHMSDPEALGKFFALVHAFLTKIYGRIKKKYDETLDGVSFHLEDGQLLINGVNVGACIQMVKKRRSKKSKIFLKGLRGRLAVLQSNRQGNPSYEKIRETVDHMARAIDEELKNFPAEVIELPPPAPLLESP
ncbi:MAG: hypothetical protein R3257_05155 [bacterium]|nr:hypothetical protein [bacterium]